ncbi:MAG TPA: transketolase family protein [Planctomycetota bacterium]|nr:transketolase family protein [Planctomycetota bacterium]
MADKVATRVAYGEALAALGERYPQIVALDADLSKSTMTVTFAKKFPDRFFQMGIAEADMVDTAAGLATCGKLPFASSFAVFASRGWEQIRNIVARAKLPVVFALTHAGVSVGEDGASAQANEDIAIFRVLPYMRVIVPADGPETKSCLEYLVTHVDGPAFVRLGREKVPVVCPDGYKFELGKALTVRGGKDISIIACGVMVSIALQAAEMLAAKGVDARVINMASIKPIDRDAIVAAASETAGIVTAEEHSVIGGLGGAVAEVVAETHPCPIRRVGMADKFGESGAPAELMKKYEHTPEKIVEFAETILKKS